MKLIDNLKKNVTVTIIIIGASFIVSAMILLKLRSNIIDTQTYIIVMNNNGEIFPCIKSNNDNRK